MLPAETKLAARSRDSALDAREAWEGLGGRGKGGGGPGRREGKRGGGEAKEARRRRQGRGKGRLLRLVGRGMAIRWLLVRAEPWPI